MRPDSTTQAGQDEAERLEQLVGWRLRDRLRFGWFRLRAVVQEMNYANRRMFELKMRLPGQRD
jgi:hypothetical protein